MSADRPFTESEVKFLRYIREWGKKVVFVVNKIDILSGSNEEDEVAAFVADSATRMLGVQVSTLPFRVACFAAIIMAQISMAMCTAPCRGLQPVHSRDSEHHSRCLPLGTARFHLFEQSS